MYSAKLLHYFESARFAGDLPQANRRARVENPACGDVLELAARVDGETITAARFKVKGCVPAMACASALTELIADKTTTVAGRLTRQDLERKVDGVPPASGHALDLAIEALHVLLNGV